MSSSSWNMSRTVCDRCLETIEYKSDEHANATRHWGRISVQTFAGSVFPTIFGYTHELCPKCVESFVSWFKSSPRTSVEDFRQTTDDTRDDQPEERRVT